MTYYKYIIALVSAFTFFHKICVSRSIFRPQHSMNATITVFTNDPEQASKWNINTKKLSSQLTSKYLKLKPLQEKFDYQYLKNHQLPPTITPHATKQPIQTAGLKECIHNIITTLQQGKTTLHNATIIQKRDFNFTTQSGLLVVKPHNYPVIVKLFIEHPCTFTDPFSKSFEASCMFTLGGSLRHLCGFTRIPNLHRVKAELAKHPHYKNKIKFPQKWFYIPDNTYWLNITWHNPYKEKTTDISMPAIYCIIADYIEIDQHAQQTHHRYLRNVSMDVVNFLQFAIDPHNGNFVFEKNNPNDLFIIDTEHFPTVIGLEHGMRAKNYMSWYIEMSANFVKEVLFTSKKERLTKLKNE